MTLKEARTLQTQLLASGSVTNARVMRRETGVARLGRSGRAIPQYSFEIQATDADGFPVVINTLKRIGG